MQKVVDPVSAPATRSAPLHVPTLTLTPPRIETRCAPLSQATDAYSLRHNLGTLFHTRAWCESVAATFGHKPMHIVARRDSEVVGVFPLFLVRSRIAGRMLVSVPYGVGGGIIADDQSITDALFSRAKDLAQIENCAYLDMRSERAVLQKLPTVDRYVGFRRELPTRAEDVATSLPRKARAAARNARRRHGLTVTYGDHQLSDAWRLYTISMRRLGSLNYPFSFFEALLSRTPNGHRVSLVHHRGVPVAGLVTFFFRDRVMPYFFGSTDSARRCCAANLIYLDAMQHGVHEGFREFDFGRSRRENSGSANFKRFQGFEPRLLEYQCHTLFGHEVPQLSPDSPRYRLARRVWPRLPLIATQWLGAMLARHIPG